MPTSDLMLLQQWFNKRDAEAFKEITNRHTAMVYATCLRILRNSNDAEDVAQECFEQLVTTDKPPRTNLAAWLHRVAANRALNRIKSDKRRRNREASFMSEHGDGTEIEWDDIYDFVDEAILELPEKLRIP